MIGLRTLVLNSNYLPISLFPLHTIPAEDAVTRLCNETCHVVYNYNREILSPTVNMKWPSIIARNEHTKLKEVVKLRRESVFYRDHGLCAYCEKPLTLNEVTYDHVIPKKFGGDSTWNNIVCSCSLCNSKKGHNLPKGEWVPRLKPYQPTYWQLLENRRKFPITIDDPRWEDFMGDWKAPVHIRAV